MLITVKLTFMTAYRNIQLFRRECRQVVLIAAHKPVTGVGSSFYSLRPAWLRSKLPVATGRQHVAPGSRRRVSTRSARNMANNMYQSPREATSVAKPGTQRQRGLGDNSLGVWRFRDMESIEGEKQLEIRAGSEQLVSYLKG